MAVLELTAVARGARSRPMPDTNLKRLSCNIRTIMRSLLVNAIVNTMAFFIIQQKAQQTRQKMGSLDGSKTLSCPNCVHFSATSSSHHHHQHRHFACCRAGPELISCLTFPFASLRVRADGFRTFVGLEFGWRLIRFDLASQQTVSSAIHLGSSQAYYSTECEELLKILLNWFFEFLPSDICHEKRLL